MTGSGPAPKPLLDDSQKQRIVAMVCGKPPEGRARWTVRLVAQEAVKRKLVPQRGPRDNPGAARKPRLEAVAGKKCGAWRNWIGTYIERMEDVLAVYEKPYQAAEPVVCLDEKPVSLHADVRPPRPARPGKPLRPDNEYKRCGTANVFGVVEPKAGRHFTTATPNRSAAQFAQVMQPHRGAISRRADHPPRHGQPQYPLLQVAGRTPSATR